MEPLMEFLARAPRVALLPGPTPLHPLARFCARPGVQPLIKRDDMTGVGPGGNKIRSLEFLLGQAMAQGCDCVLAAGLVYGNALLGSPFRIVVVSVEDEAPVLEAHMEAVIRQAEAIAGLSCPAPVNRLCTITDRYRGGGWGMNTPASAAMVETFARQEGLFVENVYTSKVLVGMEDWVRAGKADGPVCFLHTGGFGSLFSQYEG